MRDLKAEIVQLKAENKKLKALLKNAVGLLHKSREFLQRPGKPPEVKRPTTTAGKKRRSGSPAARGAARK